MYRYVARANIDRYLSLLMEDQIPPETRVTITRLLIEEEDKLGHDLEQLEFAETRAAMVRDRLNSLRTVRNGSVAASLDRAQADRLLANFEAIQQLLEDFCHKIRQRVNSRAL